MRISFVARLYAPSQGGAQELVQGLAEELAGRGHEVRVLTTDALRSPLARDPGRIESAGEVIGGVQVRRFRTPAAVAWSLRAMRKASSEVRRRRGLPVGDVAPWLQGPWSPGLVRAARDATRTDDVVVGCSAPFTSLLAPTWFRRGAQARTVALPLLHVTSSIEADVDPTVRRALCRSDRVVALTAFEREVDVAVGVEPEAAVVVPGAVHPTAYPDLDPQQARRALGLAERPTVGFVGRLAPYKGVDTFLDAARRIWAERPDTTVLVAGNPSGWDGYRDPALVALAGDRLVVREQFPADERALLLAACDVVVHPSRAESFGMVTIESWAARRPIVVGDIPAVRSLVEDVPAGLLVAPGDDDALARTLLDLLADPARCRALGAQGRVEVEARFSWEQVGDAWDRLMRGLATPATTTVGAP